MALYSLCSRCSSKIEYRQRYCDECKSIIEVEKEKYNKIKNKKYNHDRYIKDKANESYRLFYTTQAWKNKRAEILKRDNHECQMCKALCRYKPATDVHHILNLLDNYDKRLYNDNLISLCHECHYNIVHALDLNNKNKIEKYINQKINSDKFIKELLKMEK
ncbi:MAG: HNH endonuclease [Clostridia bacterium]